MMAIFSMCPLKGRISISGPLLFSFALLTFVSNSGSYASPVKVQRNVSNSCSPVTPCGWLVYLPESKSPDYYVRSPCTCPSNEICVRDSEDIAITSYIYRCRSPADAKGLDELKDEVDTDTGASSNILISGFNRVVPAGGHIHP